MGKPHLDGYDQGQFLVVRAESPAVDSTLVGRTDDLAALRRAFERAGSGQAQVVVVEGEAGMGKSALLEAFLDELPTGSGTHQVWTVRCDAFEQDDAYGSLGLLLGETEPIESSTLAAGRLVLSRLGTGRRDGVTVLAVDDAQWIDRPSAQAIRFALRRLRADNVLTVITRRPDSPDAVELLSEELNSSTTLLRQQPLDASAVRDLARRTRRWEIAPDVASSLIARTGGVPLLVAAVLRGAPDQSSLATDIPATVEAAALRMLGSVDAHTRSFVEASAVLAEPADVIAVGQVADSTTRPSRWRRRYAPVCCDSDRRTRSTSRTHCSGMPRIGSCRPAGGWRCMHGRRTGPPATGASPIALPRLTVPTRCSPPIW